MTAGGRSRVAALALTIGLGLLASDHAAAQPKAKKPPPPVLDNATDPRSRSLDFKTIGEGLRGNDPGGLAVALEEAQRGGHGAAAAAPAIEELLKRGSTNDLTKAAIEALGAIGQPSASAVLRPYARHRLEDVRRAAIKALVNTKGPDALAAFKEGLRASDPVVRGVSATGLGTLGAHEAMADLFEALDRDVAEAAPAIGRLCSADECERFAAKLGALRLDVMIPGFDAMFFRAHPHRDETLLFAVGKLRALGTAESRAYLADVERRWPKDGSARVKQAIDGALVELAGAKQP